MSVDVIIPTYNRSDWIEKSIESVLGQTFRDLRLFVIDDGSSDDTYQKIKQFEKDSRFYYEKIEHGGVSRARNYGVSLGSAPWVAFLDSDDQWLLNKLGRQVSFACDYPNYPLIHCDEIWIRRGKRVNPKNKHRKGGGDQFSRSLKLCLISPSAVLVKRDIFEKWGGFDEKFLVCEDYDLWLKITSQHLVGFIDEPLIIKNGGHEDQLSHRYVAMDEWRVLSMINLYKNADLTYDQSIELFQEALEKIRILCLGYEKHKHFDKLRQFQELQAWIEKQRHATLKIL